MLNVHELPYLTAEVPGLGGAIKSRPEDFKVEEVPLYEPSGSGTHVYFRVEKQKLATMRLVYELARALKRKPAEFGYAGMKDADAVTVQTISLEHVDPEQVQSVFIPNVRILDVARHTNKLKLGHLKGNRFTIKLRDVDTQRIDDARSVLDVLTRRGVPNYFGEQRFGLRGDTWEVGRALLRQDYREAVEVILGRPGPADYGEVRQARQLFDQGDYLAAADAWPHPFHNEKQVARAMDKYDGDAQKALKTVDKKLRRFYFSAYQSQLFNQVVARRLENIDSLLSGDWAWRHPQGAVFKVENVEREQPRCDVFEISPTGPLFGYKMRVPDGQVGWIEQEVLDEEQLTLDDWRESGKHKIKGGRRPLRFQPQETRVESGSDDAGDCLQLTFYLEAGCYATTVLREICKWPGGPKLAQ